MSEDARDLVQRATRGDGAAVEALLERNLPRLRAYVRAKTGRQLHRRESVSDLVQSACREVLQDLPELEFGDEVAFRSFLLRAALRKIMDRARYHSAAVRDARVEQCLDDDTPLANFLTPSREAVGRERLARFEAAFARLPDDHREAIVLHKIVGLPYAEVATELGRTQGAARNLVYRGLARLTELLRE